MRSDLSRPLLRPAVLAAAMSLCACGALGNARAATPRPPLPYPSSPGPAVAVGADTLTVLARGAVAFPVIEDLLRHAAHRVELEMYELQRPVLIAALRAAHDRGIRVTVIDDPTAAGSAAAAAHLRAAGVDVLDYPVRRLMIDHVKLLVVDDAAVVGGINWGTASAAHHDFDVLLRGPVVANLHRVFLRDLITCGRRGPAPGAVADPDGVEVASTLPGTEIRPFALEAVEAARHTLDLELFVLTDVGIVHGLERARARGVAVRVLLDPGQRPSDAAAAELASAGVPVRLYHGAGELLHAKSIVADSTLVLFGSANWSGGGFVRNHEVDVEVRSAAVASTFLAAMNADWSRSAGPSSSAAEPEADGPP